MAAYNLQQRLSIGTEKDVNKQKLCVKTDPTLRQIVTHAAGIPAKLRKVSRRWHWPDLQNNKIRNTKEKKLDFLVSCRQGSTCGKARRSVVDSRAIWLWASWRWTRRPRPRRAPRRRSWRSSRPLPWGRRTPVGSCRAATKHWWDHSLHSVLWLCERGSDLCSWKWPWTHSSTCRKITATYLPFLRQKGLFLWWFRQKKVKEDRGINVLTWWKAIWSSLCLGQKTSHQNVGAKTQQKAR